MKQNKLVSNLASLIPLVIFLGAFLMISLPDKQTSHWIPIVENRQSPIPELWEHQGVSIKPDNQHQLVVAQDKLIYIGTDSPDDEPFHVNALDKNTGTKIWQYGTGDEICLATSASLIFVGGVGKVDALNLDDGSIAWTTNLPFTRSVTKLLARDNILYVDTVSANHFLLEIESGKILQSISYPNDNVPIWSDHLMDFVLEGNIMYFQKHTKFPDSETELIAIDNLTDTQLWNVNIPSISRITANSFGAYLLTLDGKLVKFDPRSGDKTDIIQFVPPPILRHYSEKGTARELGYHVAVDTENRLVFVYLGDSTQLFAYHLPQE